MNFTIDTIRYVFIPKPIIPKKHNILVFILKSLFYVLNKTSLRFCNNFKQN